MSRYFVWGIRPYLLKSVYWFQTGCTHKCSGHCGGFARFDLSFIDRSSPDSGQVTELITLSKPEILQLVKADKP